MHPRARQIVAWIGGALGVALIVAGLLINDTTQWRLQLLAGLWLLSLPLRLRRPAQATVAGRGLGRLTLVFVLGFVGVALQLTRDQISQAVAIRSAAATLLEPADPQRNAPNTQLRPADRTALGSGYTRPVTLTQALRGAIFDRNGVVLASTQNGRRVYANPDLGQIIGFQSRLYGLTGLEASYDSYLSGARTLSPTAVLGARLLGKPVAQAAADVRLTIDSQLQAVAQAALGERAGAVVLLDTQTGAILAMAGYPRFDPNQLVLPEQASEADVAQAQAAWQALTARGDSPLLNRAAQGRYPPGSVIKTLTAAAALDSGLLSGPEAQVTCPNRLETEAGAPPVRNSLEDLARRTGDPSDLRRVFAFSCNTAFAQLGLALGPERFADYAQRFGLRFADALSVTADLREIPADAGSIAGDAAFLQRPVALADTAFGQGQALVTPLDMAQLAAAIANDGKLMRPYLVQEARGGEGVLYTAQPTLLRQTISPQAAQQMRSVMQSSVEFGYAKPVALPGVTIGAKTGTAETATGVPHAWFLALAPVEQPRFAIAVIVEGGGEGSRTALPVARQVLAAALGIENAE
ncbi:MAG: penicillin-binding protein 2 [Chloroflexales bacterium]|nr:penicillin-binding protein 2 [Chloroflexales bacterium]